MIFPLTFAFACGGGGDDDGGGGGNFDANTGGGDPDANGTGGDPDANGTGGDPDANGTGAADAAPDATPIIMSITDLIPRAASRQVDTSVLVLGANFDAGALVELDNCDTDTTYAFSGADLEVATDGASIRFDLVADPTREQGLYTLRVTNPDNQTDEITCGFLILDEPPPTVTDVVPPTAFRGVAGDGVNSDSVIEIEGTGFIATPAVKWVSIDGTRTYDAQFVGFVGEDKVTAVVPSESLQMEAGEYHVFLTNPDLLTAQWLVDDGAGTLVPGVFTITEIPPPVITDLDPARIPLNVCSTTQMTIVGSGFDAAATVWWVTPTLTDCGAAAEAIADENGNVLCPMTTPTVSGAGDEILVNFRADACPPQGAWPVTVRNPDNQSDTFRNVEIRSSNDGHLDSDAFEDTGSNLNTARFKHGAEFGFDSFGRSYLFVAGGQDAAGATLSTVEVAELDVFGNVGPWQIPQQFQNADNPRIDNTLTAPRQGVAMVRVGKELYVIGGTDTSTDTTTQVAALTSSQHASILSFREMPFIKQPTVTGPDGLPTGAWYYVASAVGPWGESLGTREVVALNAGGTITVCWNDPQLDGTTSFNLYRSRASDGRSATAALLAVGIPVDPSGQTCFVDDGTEALAPAPGRLRGTPVTGGALAVASHRYRVSAIVPLAAGGELETQAGYSITVASDATNNAILLNWDEVPGATGYNVYKLDTATGEDLLLDGMPVTATTFTDTGVAFAASNQLPRERITPLGPGSLSLWDEITLPPLNIARDGAEGVVVAMDPATSDGQVARIVVAGGRSLSDAAAYLTSAESIGLYDDGTVDPAWTNETAQFGTARAFYALVTTQNREQTPFPPDPEEPPCGDLDNDGFISCACAGANDTGPFDCDDGDPNTFPGAPEVCGDGIDQDCSVDGTTFVCDGADEECVCPQGDVDQDGHFPLSCGGDDCCDDGTEDSMGCSADNADGINPDVEEVCGDGIDQDCDGVDPACECDIDVDGDGHFAISCGGDDCCDDGSETILGCTPATDQDIHPGAPDFPGDSINHDCVPDGVAGPAPSGSTAPSGGIFSRFRQIAATGSYDRQVLASASTATSSGSLTFATLSDEPIYLVAVHGDEGFLTNTNRGQDTMEACLVDPTTGLLACQTWVFQTGPGNSPSRQFGNDALLYFDQLYGFGGIASESTAASSASRSVVQGNIDRFNVTDPDLVTADQVIGGRQSANTAFATLRGYYKSLRLLSYIYAVGGVNSSGVPVATVERHLQ